MSKKKKIIITVISVIGGIIVLLGIYICWAIWGGYDGNIALAFQTNAERIKARSTVKEYIMDKYGEEAKIISVKEHMGGGGFFGPPLHLDAVEVFLPGYSVFIDGDTVCDNRQYEEICSAVQERFFDDADLGSSNTGSLSVFYSEAEGISEDAYHSTSVYYDGDIESFLRRSDAGLGAEFVYEGYPDKSGDYRKLLEDKLDDLKYYFNDNALTVTIHVKNPGLDLPEMPYARETNHDNKMRQVPMYDEFMELIACAYINHSDFKPYNCTVLQPEFRQIDEYTAVSDNATPIRSDKEITFEQVDLSDNTTVYRGRYKYDDRKDKNILTTRDTGWRIELADRKLYSVFLRLDREHYNITDTAIPLIVADLTRRDNPLSDWETKRYYITVGYGNYVNVDTNLDDWYYLDDKYLYLRISHVQSDLDTNWVLTFSDSPLPE